MATLAELRQAARDYVDDTTPSVRWSDSEVDRYLRSARFSVVALLYNKGLDSLLGEEQFTTDANGEVDFTGQNLVGIRAVLNGIGGYNYIVPNRPISQRQMPAKQQTPLLIRHCRLPTFPTLAGDTVQLSQANVADPRIDDLIAIRAAQKMLVKDDHQSGRMDKEADAITQEILLGITSSTAEVITPFTNFQFLPISWAFNGPNKLGLYLMV